MLPVLFTLLLPLLLPLVELEKLARQAVPPLPEVGLASTFIIFRRGPCFGCKEEDTWVWSLREGRRRCGNSVTRWMRALGEGGAKAVATTERVRP